MIRGSSPQITRSVLVVLVMALTATAFFEAARQLAALVLLAVAPGLAITHLAGISDRTLRLILIVPVSLAVNMLIASAVVYLDRWSPTLVLAVVIALTVGALALVHRRRSAIGALALVGILPAIVVLIGGR